MENYKEYIAIASHEISHPEWAHTKQILEVNEIEQDTDGYKVYAIIEKDDLVYIYFNIKEEAYYLRIIIEKYTKRLRMPDIINASYCYLTAISQNKTLSELASYTKFKYTDGYSKGDKIKNGRIANVSYIKFALLDKDCYFAEEAIELLLNKLSEDKDGIKKLVQNSDAIIEVKNSQYVSANAGFSLSSEIIKKLNDFGLGFDIDTYICGKPFIS